MDIIKLNCWLIVTIVATTHFSSDAYFSMYRAQQAYKNSNHEAAREILGASVVCDPSNWRALCNLGTLALQGKEYADAIKHFEKTLEINPNCSAAREQRDYAKKMLEEQEQQQNQKQEQDKKQEEQKHDHEQKQQNDQNSTQQNKDEQNSKNQSQESDKKRPHEQDQQAQDPKLDQQNGNGKSENDTQQQQEQRSESSENKEQEGKNTKQHGAPQQQQEESKHDKGDQPQHTENPQKIKDGWDDIPLTKREKQIVELVEDADKAAQQYMMMCTRKARQHGSQKDW